MKGYRTVLFGAMVAVVPALLTYMNTIDWTAYGPWITGVVGVITIALRAITTTPMTQKE